MAVHSVGNYQQWKLSPLTFISLRLGEGNQEAEPPEPWNELYSFNNLQKGSYFGTKEIREPNDKGGFEVVAYEIDIKFMPVELVQNYYTKFNYHFRKYAIKSLLVKFGKPFESGFASHEIDTDDLTVTVMNLSTSQVTIENEEHNLQTIISIKGICSIDLFTDTQAIFADLN